MDERAEIPAMRKGRFLRFRIGGIDHLRETGALLHLCDQIPENIRIATFKAETDPVDDQVLSHAREHLVEYTFGDSGHPGLFHGVIDHEDDAWLVVERLLMPVKDVFLTHHKGTFTDPHPHRKDGGTGGSSQQGTGLLVKIRALVDVCLARSKFHGKCKAGRITALFAVCLGEQFIDIQRLESHELHLPPPFLRAEQCQRFL